MSLEKNIERIATALERIADHLEAAPASVPAPTPTPEPEPEPKVEVDPLDEPQAPEPEEEKFTEDQVRKALQNYREINGTDAVMAVLEAHGAKGMGSLKPESYASVMKSIR